MIRLTNLVKHFPGVAKPSVDRLCMEVPEGEICVLIGPSGCGKTTTMRMINRMIEPSSGNIELHGQDVMAMNPVELRRQVGYVIQQIGLFPHMTIAENIATVPKLLNWPKSRIDSRIDEMLDLVSMDPGLYRDRFPRELSGGQRQRVGVARALAADPPVMLMDEPFGAIDPITRGKMQDEFLKILRRLNKTIIFVTHDMDEAIKMGDRIAILKDGHLLQYGTPEEILCAPVDGFVESFVGGDRALKRLSLIEAGSLATGGTAFALEAVAAERVPHHLTLRDALARMLNRGSDCLVVTDAAGGALGVVTLDAIRAQVCQSATVAQPLKVAGL
jgi:osmoprotectant transport system ATP-binding protein